MAQLEGLRDSILTIQQGFCGLYLYCFEVAQTHATHRQKVLSTYGKASMVMLQRTI